MYKQSNYNYFIQHESRVIAFNGFSGQIFSFSEKEYEFYEKMSKDLIAFEILYSSVFAKFKEWNFIVDESQDELELIRFRNKNAVFMNRTYNLIVNTTLNCNFNCWYCYQKHDEKYMTPETIERIKKHVSNMVESKEITGLDLSWFGGEPFMYFNEVIYPISIFMKDLMHKNKLSFHNSATTNGSLIDETNIEKIKEIGLNTYQITIDGDEERHNKIRNVKGEPSFKKIMGSIALICDNIEDANITLRINYDDSTLKESKMKEVFEGIKPEFRKKISPNFQRVWQSMSKDQINTENKERVDLYGLCRELGYLVRTNSNAFTINKGYKCYVDRYYHTELNYDGVAYKCTAQSYTKENAFGKLDENGNLSNDQIKISKMFSKACFENEMCLNCKHLPICNGPCTQKVISTPNDKLSEICTKKLDEVSVNTFIVDLYKDKMKRIKDAEIINV